MSQLLTGHTSLSTDTIHSPIPLVAVLWVVAPLDVSADRAVEGWAAGS